MSLAAYLTAIAVSLPAPWYPPDEPVETCAERLDRVMLIAEAHAIEAELIPDGWGWDARDLALAGLVVTWHESGRWRLEVHDGSKRGDGGKSVCIGQIHGGTEDLVGTSLEATRRCVREVYRHLGTHWRRCLRADRAPEAYALGAVFAGYGTGHSCDPMHDSPHLGRGWALSRAEVWWRWR